VEAPATAAIAGRRVRALDGVAAWREANKPLPRLKPRKPTAHWRVSAYTARAIRRGEVVRAAGFEPASRFRAGGLRTFSCAQPS